MADGNDHLVRPEWACPLCGERRADFLVVHDEDKPADAPESDVTCAMCGTEYRLRLGGPGRD
jgi:rubredoxin